MKREERTNERKVCTIRILFNSHIPLDVDEEEETKKSKSKSEKRSTGEIKWLNSYALCSNALFSLMEGVLGLASLSEASSCSNVS